MITPFKMYSVKKCVVVSSLFLLLHFIAASGCRFVKDQKYNVLLITIDTLRTDHLSCYGYAKKTSPAIDAFAREGILFTNTIAQRGQTWPSLTSILTSMYPAKHGVRENGDKLEASKTTIAEILKKEGFKTAAVLTNMQTAPNRGFDSKLLIGIKPLLNATHVDKKATHDAVQWLRENSKDRFFLWTHYLAPHRPYMPPEQYSSKFAKGLDAKQINAKLNPVMINKIQLSVSELDQIYALYDGEVAYVDDQIRTLLEELDNLEL